MIGCRIVCSAGSAELRAADDEQRHVECGRTVLHAAVGLLTVRRRRQDADLLQHHPGQGRLSRRLLSARVERGSRLHPQTPRPQPEVRTYVLSACSIPPALGHTNIEQNV